MCGDGSGRQPLLSPHQVRGRNKLRLSAGLSHVATGRAATTAGGFVPREVSVTARATCRLGLLCVPWAQHCGCWPWGSTLWASNWQCYGHRTAGIIWWAACYGLRAMGCVLWAVCYGLHAMATTLRASHSGNCTAGRHCPPKGPRPPTAHHPDVTGALLPSQPVLHPHCRSDQTRSAVGAGVPLLPHPAMQG